MPWLMVIGETIDYTGLSTAVSTGIADILPTAIVILGAMLGVSIIPRIIYKFM